MSSRSRRDSQELMRAYTLLGQRVARKDRQLAELSCMEPSIREMVGFIDSYNELNGTNEYQSEKKALIKLGRATWPRKELTDLALRVGDQTVYASFGDDKAESEEDGDSI